MNLFHGFVERWNKFKRSSGNWRDFEQHKDDTERMRAERIIKEIKACPLSELHIEVSTEGLRGGQYVDNFYVDSSRLSIHIRKNIYSTDAYCSILQDDNSLFVGDTLEHRSYRARILGATRQRHEAVTMHLRRIMNHFLPNEQKWEAAGDELFECCCEISGVQITARFMRYQSATQMGINLYHYKLSVTGTYGYMTHTVERYGDESFFKSLSSLNVPRSASNQVTNSDFVLCTNQLTH